ncbi:DUF805 domain-containing protein [Acinetobacter shaoyimingii]|uniref:DUF805 domain-containing protein n=1 Tax=Acinetobacter shaoyimingii TaxID=2715164 RepID=A0A6G8RVH8_9GAMM|nr:DUF805 domain-containing protein [Acinetobacter shaoyimingii]QIO05939.1 DUF805 domain-containing protein [Acinetobacter shaoyimingii]
MSYLETKNVQDNPLSHKGRFSRLSYLAWTFIISIIYSATLFLVLGVGALALFSSGAGFGIENLFSSGLGYLAVFLFVIVIIAFFVLLINITIRRLHDLNKSGWLALLMFVPLVNIGFSIYVYCFKGPAGANNYGPARPTEQAEKYLGVIYAIFLVIVIFAYGVAIVAVQKYRNAPSDLTTLGQSELNYEDLGLSEEDIQNLQVDETLPEDAESELQVESNEVSDDEAVAAAERAAEAALHDE